ncbi:MAG: alpha-glucuronidase family glycosyl hydrolase, partial [Terracidiphilus sp.]
MRNRRDLQSGKIDLFRAIAVAALFAAGAIAATAQTMDETWLRHGYFHGFPPVPMHVRALGHEPIEKTAVKEIVNGVDRLFGSAPSSGGDGASDEIVVGTVQEFRSAYPKLNVPSTLSPEGFWIAEMDSAGRQLVVVVGGSERGVLYGAFALIRKIATISWNPKTTITEAPAMPIRWTDEWDNADGTIVRGYAGRSIFFENGKVRDDLNAVGEYARLLASVGINGCNVNNVNDAAPFLEPQMIQGLKRIADTMRPWGVRLAISVDIASPQKIGGLKTFDPLDPAVQAWWAAKADEIYAEIPDFAGFTVKADSEGQAGPASYGRSPADAANLLARALAPHGGVVLYRAFVYNNHLDYNDMKADRARAAYDIFHPLDGKFDANVIVQIKYGPIDFQAREPVSPLFAGLEKTNSAMELQITQ